MRGKMIAIIAAMAKNRVIGRAGRIPWNLPEDMRHFRELTLGHIIVMGRRTYEEIGHPLPGRTTYLISSAIQVEKDNCHTVSSLEEVLQRESDNDIFICGGAMLYQEALPHATYLYLTELEEEVEGDICFPEFDVNDYEVVDRVPQTDASGAYSYSFVTYKRKNK